MEAQPAVVPSAVEPPAAAAAAFKEQQDFYPFAQQRHQLEPEGPAEEDAAGGDLWRSPSVSLHRAAEMPIAILPDDGAETGQFSSLVSLVDEQPDDAPDRASQVGPRGGG